MEHLLLWLQMQFIEKEGEPDGSKASVFGVANTFHHGSDIVVVRSRRPARDCEAYPAVVVCSQTLQLTGVDYIVRRAVATAVEADPVG